MIVPGSNLLNMALRVIQPQGLGWRAFVSRSVNAAGDFVNTYADSVNIQGSMQPLEKKLYQELGLNLAKNYSVLFTSAQVRHTTEDRSGDLLTYGGLTWCAESDTDWAVADGWRYILCVEVRPDE